MYSFLWKKYLTHSHYGGIVLIYLRFGYFYTPVQDGDIIMALNKRPSEDYYNNIWYNIILIFWRPFANSIFIQVNILNLDFAKRVYLYLMGPICEMCDVFGKYDFFGGEGEINFHISLPIMHYGIIWGYIVLRRLCQHVVRWSDARRRNCDRVFCDGELSIGVFRTRSAWRFLKWLYLDTIDISIQNWIFTNT